MENKKIKILVTGCAGFIGFHLVSRLVNKNFIIIGIDNMSDYYSVNLKENRLKNLGFLEGVNENKNKCLKSSIYSNLEFYNSNIQNSKFISKIFSKYKFNIVVHLAAQAGVRYSLINPESYIKTNINGFFNVINNSNKNRVEKFIYASSSSVYGDRSSVPFFETDNLSKPESIYAATKISNELIAYTYSKLYNLSTVGLRFFTVYGPWGRPDMAYFSFANSLFKNKPIDLYNKGKMLRDFTYIDDIIDSMMKIVLDKRKDEKNNEKYKVYNLGNNNPIDLMTFIKVMEKSFNIKFRINLLPHQKGDVKSTHASVKIFENDYGFISHTDLREGMKSFANWYKTYYGK